MGTMPAAVPIGVVPYPLWPFGPSPPDRGSRPRTPDYGGVSLRYAQKFRRAKFEWILRRFPAHWGLVPSKFMSVCMLPHPAWCLPTRLVRWWSAGGRSPLLQRETDLCKNGGPVRTPAPTPRTKWLSVGADVLIRPQQPRSPGSAKAGGVRTARTVLNFPPSRAQWPGGKKGKPLRFFPPDESAKLTVGYPRKRGSGGQMTVSTRCA